MEYSKSDWKLFQSRIGGWQENYMERLNQEYVKLLTGDMHPSEKFWALDKRLHRDKKKPDVQLMLSKNEMGFQIAELIQDGAISFDELDGFSEELIHDVKFLLNR